MPESAIPTHGDGANRNDNKYVANLTTYRRVVKENSLGIEFAGNFPDVTQPATPEQAAALLKLLPFLQERYGIPPEKRLRRRSALERRVPCRRPRCRVP